MAEGFVKLTAVLRWYSRSYQTVTFGGRDKEYESIDGVFLVLDAASTDIRSVEETIGKEECKSNLFFHFNLMWGYFGSHIQSWSCASSPFPWSRVLVEFWTLWLSTLLGERGSRPEQMGRLENAMRLEIWPLSQGSQFSVMFSWLRKPTNPTKKAPNNE